MPGSEHEASSLLSFSPEEEVFVPDDEEEVGHDEQRRGDDEGPVFDAVAELLPAGLRLVDLDHLETVATKLPVSLGGQISSDRERFREGAWVTSKEFSSLKMSCTKNIEHFFKLVLCQRSIQTKKKI